jgi:hypothetical protein
MKNRITNYEFEKIMRSDKAMIKYCKKHDLIVGVVLLKSVVSGNKK